MRRTILILLLAASATPATTSFSRRRSSRSLPTTPRCAARNSRARRCRRRNADEVLRSHSPPEYLPQSYTETLRPRAYAADVNASHVGRQRRPTRAVQKTVGTQAFHSYELAFPPPFAPRCRQRRRVMRSAFGVPVSPWPVQLAGARSDSSNARSGCIVGASSAPSRRNPSDPANGSCQLPVLSMM